MMNTLLFVHFVIALMLIILILLQRTSTDTLAGLTNNPGGSLTKVGAAKSFVKKLTIVFAIAFFINAIILGNLSARKDNSQIKIDQLNGDQNNQKTQDKQDTQDDLAIDKSL